MAQNPGYAQSYGEFQEFGGQDVDRSYCYGAHGAVDACAGEIHIKHGRHAGDYEQRNEEIDIPVVHFLQPEHDEQSDYNETAVPNDGRIDVPALISWIDAEKSSITDTITKEYIGSPDVMVGPRF